ncbi:MAG TPA: DNA repair protein RecO [Bacteroidales bacterium]
MLLKIKAIVLHCLAYNDTTNIVHLYTEDFGRMSYLASRSRSKKSNLKSAFFMPLSLVEIEADHKGSRNLQRIKEVRSIYNFSGIPYDQAKNAMSLFLAEVLYRSLRETEKNPTLFEYLFRSIQYLDLCEKGLANFHLVFLIKLTRFLGFYPNVEGQAPNWYFDLQGGCFTPTRPLHNAWLTPAESTNFAILMRMNFDNMQAFQFERHQRVHILRQMMDYYRIHLADFPEIKSLNVLQELYD